MNVLSLFDGLSGGMVALERAGIEVDKYYASEIDKYAIEVSKNNYPDIVQLGSVVDLTEEQLLELGDIDLLIGGSPCQGFSMAGKMKGSATKCGKEVTSLQDYLDLKRMGFEFDGQSYLFWEYIRIRDIVKPKWFMLENVKVTKKWKPMFDEAMGVDGVLINSNLFSAQNRPRYYWTNIEFDKSIKDKGVRLKDILEDLPFRELKPFVYGYFGDNQRIKGMKTIVSDKGNCVTTSKTHTNQYYLNEDKTKMRNLSPVEYERLQTLPDNYTNHVADGKRYHMIGNGWTIDVIAHIFNGLKNDY
jgi:site-specific DNA-cytosine methylase